MARHGLLLDAPARILPGGEGSAKLVMFADGAEARAVVLPNAWRSVARVREVGVGIAVVEGRVLGYVDVAPEAEFDGLRPCVLVSPEGREPFLVAGVSVVGAGTFGEGTRPGTVRHGDRDVPVADLAALAVRAEADAATDRRLEP